MPHYQVEIERRVARVIEFDADDTHDAHLKARELTNMATADEFEDFGCPDGIRVFHLGAAKTTEI